MSAAWAWAAATVGFGLIGWGISPLSGSSPETGFTERGCVVGLTAVGVIKVLG